MYAREWKHYEEYSQWQTQSMPSAGLLEEPDSSAGLDFMTSSPTIDSTHRRRSAQCRITGIPHTCCAELMCFRHSPLEFDSV